MKASAFAHYHITGFFEIGERKTDSKGCGTTVCLKEGDNIPVYETLSSYLGPSAEVK
jgi:pantoate kinase